MDLPDPASVRGEHLFGVEELERLPAERILAPVDLQAVKAAGVTFAISAIERVIEERARGDFRQAAAIRHKLEQRIGGAIRSVVPGSEGAARLKDALIEDGLWSQYLEVAIGPDAEIFTKTAPLASVGSGAKIGVRSDSSWNNPEPEVVLVVNSRGEIRGATLGNDVNLRDFEGRSALLLSKAKDNNASCAIGPFIRLFDAHFGVDDVRRCELAMRVDGADGFVLDAASSMSRISRDPLELVTHAIGPNHQYPDGLVLVLGTMFAPTQDRRKPGEGFTHEVDDIVTVKTPLLGALVNRVVRSDWVAPWTFGVAALMNNLGTRGLLKASGALP
jgi:fumarylacetoacetate (FAA) hydrolase family protein